MCHFIQVHSSKKANNRQFLGNLEPFSFGIQKFSQAYGIEENNYQSTICEKIRLMGPKIWEL